MQATLKSQVVTEEVLAGPFRLKGLNDYRDVFIKRSLNTDERSKFKFLKEDVKSRYKERSMKGRKVLGASSG